MQASWVQQGTTTTGTDTITLNGTTSSGYQAFSSAFSSGDAVPYTIIDGNNRETGYGTLTSGANWTLSRDVVYETLVSGTYAKYPSASAITLSGSAVVSINATAMSNVSPVRNYNIGGSGGNIDMGDSYGPSTDFSGRTFPVADRLEFESFSFFRPRIIGKMLARVTVANASAQVKAGIYTSSYDNLPDRRIAQVTFDTSTTGAKVVSLGGNLLLPPGVYFTGIASDDATTVQMNGPGSAAAGGSELGRNSADAGYGKISCYEDLGASWTDLPTTATVTSSETQTATKPIAGMG